MTTFFSVTFQLFVLKFSVSKRPAEVCNGLRLKSRTFSLNTKYSTKRFFSTQSLLKRLQFSLVFLVFCFSIWKAHMQMLQLEFWIPDKICPSKSQKNDDFLAENLTRNHCRGINTEPCNLICTVRFRLYIHPLRSHWGNECRHNPLVVRKLRVIKNLQLKPSLISGQCEVTGGPVPRYFLVCRW